MKIGFIGSSKISQFHISALRNNGFEIIGIGTTENRNGADLDCFNRTALIGTIGIGTTAARSHVDFGALGDNTAANAHVILPMLTDAQRGNLTPVAGSLIYNSTSNKLQFYNGSAWETVTSST